jgi:hypothetical protein
MSNLRTPRGTDEAHGLRRRHDRLQNFAPFFFLRQGWERSTSTAWLLLFVDMESFQYQSN